MDASGLDQKIPDPGSTLKTKPPTLWQRVLTSILVVKQWTRVQQLTSIGLYMHTMAWGMYSGCLSSSLLDFELLTSSSTTQIGLMFTVRNVAGICGAVVGGQLLVLLDSRLLLSLSCFSYALTVGLLPWARNFWQLMVFGGMNGFVAGIFDTAENILELSIWGWNSFVYMQLFHCCYAIGTFIAPWIAKPFLAPTWYEPIRGNSTNGTSTAPPESNSTNNSVDMELVVGESRIMYAFMIIGMYFFVTGIFYFIIYVFAKKYKNVAESIKNETKKKEENQEESPEAETRNPNQKKLWYLIPMTAMASVRFCCYVGLEIMFSTFLMTYAVKGLGFGKSDGLLVTTAYLGSFAASRMISVFIAMCISPTVYVMFDIVTMVLAFACMVAFVKLHPIVLVLCSVLTGMAQASFYGCSMSWASKYMYITERIVSAFTTGSWIGKVIFPALAGYLIDQVSPQSFLYLGLADTLLVAGVTMVATVIGLKYGAPLTVSSKPQNVHRPPEENRITQL